MMLKGVASCEKSNLVLFDDEMKECGIVQSATDTTGLSECHLMCHSQRSSTATIKFEEARFGPQQWLICEMYEARNKFKASISHIVPTSNNWK